MPNFAIVPFDAVGLKVSADKELADGNVLVAVIAKVAEPVCTNAIGAKQAELVVGTIGDVSCNAPLKQGVLVGAPVAVDANWVALAVNAIVIAYAGRSLAWQDMGPVRKLFNAGNTAPLGLREALAFELASASDTNGVAALCALGKMRLISSARLATSALPVIGVGV